MKSRVGQLPDIVLHVYRCNECAHFRKLTNGLAGRSQIVARIARTVFVLCALVIVPSIFFLRYKQWPIYSCVPPRNAYMAVIFC